MWVKSTFSSGSEGCVEVDVAPAVVRVRDSKLGEGSPVLEFNEVEWKAFVAGVRDGQFAI
jgi:hypothetical protein